MFFSLVGYGMVQVGILFHGTFLVMERIGFNQILNFAGKISAVSITFLIVTLGWVLFRTTDLNHAIYYYANLFDFSSIDLSHIEQINSKVIFIFCLGSFFAFIPNRYQNFFNAIYTISKTNRFLMTLTGVCCLLLYIYMIGDLMTSGFNPFIYFRF